jgi:hypothetical protein
LECPFFTGGEVAKLREGGFVARVLADGLWKGRNSMKK